MAEKKIIDKIDAGAGHIHIRYRHTDNNGEVRYTRVVLAPGDNVLPYPKEVQAMAKKLWTDDTKKRYKARLEAMERGSIIKQKRGKK